MLDDQGIGVLVLVGPSSQRPYRFWVPTSLLSNGFPGIKRSGREADHSPQTNAVMKKMWIYTFTPPFAFMA
jgi:hypothetical protein